MRGSFNLPYQDDRTYTYPSLVVPTLIAIAVSSSEIDLTASVAGAAFSYTYERAPTNSGPWTVLAIQSSTSYHNIGLSPNQLVFYRVKVLLTNGLTTSYSSVVNATTNPAGTQIVWDPGVHYSMYQFGGEGSSQATWQAEMTIVNNLNTNGICKGFELNVTPRMLFPVTQGDWGNSLGINLFIQAYNYAQGLSNGPYRVSIAQNLVGNTYAPASNIDDAFARSVTPTWWYNNTAFGPVGGNAHGGVYWDTTNGLTNLWWNAACLNDIVSCMAAMYAATEAQGKHIYRFDTCMEMSRAPVMIAAGMTEAALLSTWGGASGFAADLRNAMPTSLLNCKPTFTPSLGANMESFLGSLHANKWSPGNYDNCNEVVPSDLSAAQGHPRAFWGDMGQRGQTTVGGPHSFTDYMALGYDFQAFMGPDELGNRPTYTNPVPPANLGCGRMVDCLLHCQEVNMSHLFIASERHQGPPCNTMGTYSGQPANYQYPAGGPVVSATRSINYLNTLNVGSYLNLNYPAAW